jgi:aminopeptidase N
MNYKHMLRRLLVLSVFILHASYFAAQTRAQYLGWDYQEQARTHVTDIQHIEMHISFDAPAKKVMGTVYHTLSILPQKDPVRDIVFDAVNINIQKVWIEEGKGKRIPLNFDTTEANKLRMTLDHERPANVPFKIGIEYWAQPKRGMYFIAPDTFYTTRQEQIWTQGEGEDNRHWLPTYDYPNDKTTTEMYVTVRGDQQALSNGHLVSKDKNKDGTVTWHYQEDKPYSTYLIMLGIGNYEVPTDKWRGKDVQYWVYPGWSKEAHRIFGLTPEMLEFFSTRTGFPYAWEKYAQIAIADFMYGGMENVSATTLNDYVLYDQRMGVDFSGEGLIAHELAHQWFGDVVTCRSWIQMWLNESFATYFEALFREFHDGKDEFDEEMAGAQNAGIGAESTLGKKPIVAANNYTANHYPRGAATLNMIRHILGDSAWWRSINHYLTVHQFQPVVTEDFKIAIEEATGQNLQWFFDEWLYKSGHPVFDVSYTYDDPAKVLRMTVTQTQTRDSLTGTFKMPVDVELTMPDGTTRLETIRISDSTQNFTFIAPQRPMMVIFDKGSTIIKESHIHKAPEEWAYQLQNAKLAIERSQAAMALASIDINRNPQPFETLRMAALRDPFWAVRLHALNSLGYLTDSIHRIDDVLTLLLTHDPRPDLRVAAANLMGSKMNRALATPLLLTAIDKDSSYNVVGTALATLSAYDQPKAYNLALNYLKTSYPRDKVRQSAVAVLENSKTKESLNELIRLINEHNVPKWTRYGIINAIGGMVSVDSALVYRTLWNLGTNNGGADIRGTALNKLADIGDVATLRQLEAQAATRPEMKVTYDALLERMRRRLGVH